MTKVLRPAAVTESSRAHGCRERVTVDLLTLTVSALSVMKSETEKVMQKSDCKAEDKIALLQPKS